MTYTAFSPRGPRTALAMSEDLLRWKRLGLAEFGPYRGIEFDEDDKDASLFPVAIPYPLGQSDIAMLHRPLFSGARPEATTCDPASRELDLDRGSIWISYSPICLEDGEPYALGKFASHRRLASPASPWEQLKVGGDTPPVLTRHGCMIDYHGVADVSDPAKPGFELCYSAGVMVFSKEHPLAIRYRSAEPVLTPMLPQERHGTVANVVFPTGIDGREDLGLLNRLDVYYGMADNRIGVARLDVPDELPAGGVADPPEAKV